MIDPLSHFSFAFLFHFFLWKLVASTGCGAIIGIERELKHKIAGIKTNILICVGATLFTGTAFLISSQMAGVDPSRIISYVISGIGFLGAGAIFKSQDRVIGMTTAAFIWTLASIGIIIGSGGLEIAVVLTTGLLIMTLVVGAIENRYFRKPT